MTYTSAESTVENSWWWAEKLPETCRVSWQNKFSASVGFIKKKKMVLLSLYCKPLYQLHYINCITLAGELWHFRSSRVFCKWQDLHAECLLQLGGGVVPIRILPWYVRVISRLDRRFSYFDHDGVVLTVVAAHRTRSSRISWCFPTSAIQGVYCADS